MRLLLISLMFLMSNSAWASNLEGVWQGVGTYETTSWGSFVADPVVIEIKQSGNILSSKDCWSFLRNGTNWRVCTSTDLEVNGAELLCRGSRVGSISENRVDIHYMDGNHLVEAVVELQSNGTLNFLYQTRELATGHLVKTQAIGLTR